ncbi:MAG: hypothetical protein F4190_12600 [Acidimicrobiales bacterium]|nr:hypothetical protein [Acidimicrobiales bacterium]MYG89342.1 hypothetical protein [Acidimicrobiales bacterium]MYI26644.1 hypothetical protein [Acidimicrobiales bacterium]
MSSRRRGPWGSDIVGVGVCVVLFGLLRGSPLGFTEDPQGFLAFAGIAGGLVGCLQGRPDRQQRTVRFFQEVLNGAGVFIGVFIAVLLQEPLGVILASGLIGGAIARYYQLHPGRHHQRLVAWSRTCLAWVHTRCSIPASIVAAGIALMLGLPSGSILAFALATGVAVRLLGNRSGRLGGIADSVGYRAGGTARWLKGQAVRRERQ